MMMPIKIKRSGSFSTAYSVVNPVHPYWTVQYVYEGEFTLEILVRAYLHLIGSFG